MATIANLTVKKSDGATDIVYTAVRPGSGKVPACWRVTAVTTAQAHQNDLRLADFSQENGPQRKFQLSLSVPSTYVDSATGLTVVGSRPFATATFVYDVNTPQATVDELVHQFANLLDESHIKTHIQGGYLPS